MNSVFGFGAVKFEMTYGSSLEYTREAYFSGSFSDITYEPIMLERQNVLYDDVSKLLGFKSTLKIKLINIKEDDYIQFGQLISIYNLAKQYPNGVLTIYPEYNPDIASPELYNLKLDNMRMDSSFSPQQIANAEVGQSLSVSFIGKKLLSSIPLVFSQPDISTWVDQDADSIVDDDGDTLIFA